jgi:hypothetical protein
VKKSKESWWVEHSILLKIVAPALAIAVSIATLWSTFGFPILATQTHVKEAIAPLQGQVRGLQLQTNDLKVEAVETRRAGVDRELFERQRQLDQLSSKEVTTRSIITDRIQTLTGERTDLTERLRTIRNNSP